MRLARGVVLGLVLAATAATPAHANTLPVSTNADTGAGSLRDTVAASGAGDTIVIPGSVGPIVLTSGEIDITHSLTIQGAGAGTTSISGNDNSRVFCIEADTCPGGSATTQPSVAFSGLTITRGKVAAAASAPGGGAIFSEGPLTLDRVTLTDNQVTGTVSSAGGGAIHALGPLTVSNSTIGPDNSVDLGPSALIENGGGAIYNGGFDTATLNDTTVTGNSATIHGANTSLAHGGGGLYGHAAFVLNRSSVTGNTATITATSGLELGGGGIGMLAASLTLNDSRVEDNTVTVTDPSGERDGGGAIFDASPVTLTRSTVAGNSAVVNDANGGIDGGGGGLWVGGATITDSTVANNSLTFTGGTNAHRNGGGALHVFEFPWSMSGSTIGPSNTASITLGASSDDNGGGAIFDGPGATGISNTTIVLNTLTFTGAGGGDGGGALLSHHNIPLTNATISGNTATGSQGSAVFAPAGTVTLANTIVDGACAVTGGGAVASGGHNIDTANTCALTGSGDRHDTNPMLGPLAANGGPTFTEALLAGSPAINGGAGCAATDQRGVARPKGAACDIGAYELAPPDVVTGAAGGVTTSAGTMTGTVAPNLRNAQWSFEFGPTTAYGSRTASQGAGAGNAPVAVSVPLSGLAPGTTIHYRLAATNLDGTSTGGDQSFTTAKPVALVVFKGVRLRHLTVFVRGRFAVVPIFCPVGPCKGSIALRTAAPVAAAKKKRLRVGSARFTIASGKTKNVKVRLTRRARKLVARRRSIRTIATVKASSGGQTKTLTRRVTVKLRKKRR